MPQDNKEAVKWYRKAAEQGLAKAQYNIGVAYKRGNGVGQDSKEALNWFRRAAEQGDVRAQNSLGFMYRNGLGVPQDYKEAIRLYHIAAKEGFAQVQHILGTAYEPGDRVKPDYEKELEWLGMAAEQGHARALYEVGAIYALKAHEQRESGEKHYWANYRLAGKWILAAAEGGDLQAQNHIGSWYQIGLGVPHDTIQAYKWLKIVEIEARRQKAHIYFQLFAVEQVLERLRGEMTAKEIEVAEHLVDKFFERAGR